MPSKTNYPARFPIDREWTRASWDRVLEAADRLDPDAATAALSVLRGIFPPEWTDSGEADAHPLAMEQHWHAGRLELLELGIAIAVLELEPDDLHRLRHHAEYQGVAAELRARLLLHRAGATLAPPTAPGKRCEWIAHWPNGVQLAVEVKLPHTSDFTRATYGVMGAVAHELAIQTSAVADRLPEVRATVHFGPGWRQVAAAGAISTQLLRAHVAEVAACVIGAAGSMSPFGRHDMGALGALEITSAPGAPRLVIDGFGEETDPRRIARRLTRGGVLAKAAKQIENAGVPGVVVLDIQHDAFSRNAFIELRRWLERKPTVGAILMLDRTVMADGKLYGTVDVVPGPSFEAVAPVLIGLDICTAGHLHYNPLCSPSDPCPMTWLPSLAA